MLIIFCCIPHTYTMRYTVLQRTYLPSYVRKSKGLRYHCAPLVPLFIRPRLGGWGCFLPTNSLPMGEGPRWLFIHFHTLRKVTNFYMISKPNLLIFLIFCMQLPLKNIRTNPCWHFAEIWVLHGEPWAQKCHFWRKCQFFNFECLQLFSGCL